MIKLLCPVCENPLIDNDQQVYTTWSEDVMCNENHDVKRPTLKCSKEDCVSIDFGFFDPMGSYYFKKIKQEIC